MFVLISFRPQLLASHFESTSFSSVPFSNPWSLPSNSRKGVWRKSHRLEIASALLPGFRRRAGEKGVVSPLPPALRKNGGLLIPFLPCPQDWAACGAASSSTAHTESVRTTNKISIKLSFVSSLPCFLLWERMYVRESSGFSGCWWLMLELLELAESHKMTLVHMYVCIYVCVI